MKIPTLRGLVYRVRTFTQRRLSRFDSVLPLVENKNGLEIGGPSPFFQWPLPIYAHIASLDNCVTSPDTVWANHREAYCFSRRKQPGKTIICEGSNLATIPNQSYDFVLSSHNLEHFANPVKALHEWRRITRPGGSLILVVPHHAKTFDHRRVPTAVTHMFEDYQRNTTEDDLTHLPEILELHDLKMDPGHVSFEEFKSRCENNFDNRCLHHHVFDENNVCELLEACGMDVLALELAFPFHIFLLARM
jgi:SAM-dependent methyltransferase